MHEMSICRSMLGIVLARAKQHQVGRVLEVRIEVGALRGIVPEHLEHYFQFLRKGTVAEDATLVVDTVPGEAQCQQCRCRFVLDERGYVCPDCGGSDVEVVAGLELRVKTMRVE
ncbi:MAG: hydrogenase maturation nickel metallochaperone HypA [Actinobacteria bacterium]|nr:hydrogenase maturation nickel metallochaperone HypA [Actinomycetota bacterium]